MRKAFVIDSASVSVGELRVEQINEHHVQLAIGPSTIVLNHDGWADLGQLHYEIYLANEELKNDISSET